MCETAALTCLGSVAQLYALDGVAVPNCIRSLCRGVLLDAVELLGRRRHARGKRRVVRAEHRVRAVVVQRQRDAEVQ